MRRTLKIRTSNYKEMCKQTDSLHGFAAATLSASMGSIFIRLVLVASKNVYRLILQAVQLMLKALSIVRQQFLISATYSCRFRRL